MKINPDFGEVSCAIKYRRLDQDHDPMLIEVPVYVKTYKKYDVRKIRDLIGCRLQANGRSYEAEEVGEGHVPGRVPSPTGTKMVFFHFTLFPPTAKELDIVVYYKQPLIDGIFYYLPLFEHGKSPKDPSKFLFTATSQGSAVMQMTSKHEIVINDTDSRVELVPQNDEIIKINARKGQYAAANP